MLQRSFSLLNCLCLALCVVLLSAASSADSKKEQFQNELRSIISKYSGKETDWGIAIRRADNGRSLFEKKSLRLLIPASNRKIFTTILALEKMGPQYRFQTGLYLDGPVNERGHLHGNLRIEGSGDPTFLNPRFNGGKITGTLKEWAEKVNESGVRYIHGNIVIDCSGFDPGYYSVEGLPDDYHLNYVARPSCVAINENCLALLINPGSEVGQPAEIRLYPPGAGVELINNTETVKSRSVNTLRLTRPVDSDVIMAEGRVPKDARRESRLIALRYPPRMVGNVFKDILEEKGIYIKGTVDVSYKPPGMPGRQIAVHESPPLGEILKEVNRNSNNFIAEQVYQSVSRRLNGRGTYAATRSIEKTFLDKIGVRVNDVVPEDGSGLSLNNRCTADSMVRILSYARYQPYFETFKDTLAVSGKYGTLRGRLGQRGLYNRVYAKTGTLDGVSCLSGYYFTPNGTTYVFSIIVNKTRTSSAIAAQNSILQTLMKYYSGT